MSVMCDIKKYKERLEDGIVEFMNMPISERNARAICEMLCCLERVDDFLDEKSQSRLTSYEVSEWMESMVNEDGTTGGHWTVAQTNTIPHTIPDECWNAAMNMMYSDYYGVAVAHSVNSVDFYADMAKAFVEDKDASDNKLAKYYCYVVKAE